MKRRPPYCKNETEQCPVCKRLYCPSCYRKCPRRYCEPSCCGRERGTPHKPGCAYLQNQSE